VGGHPALNGLIGAGVPQDWATHCWATTTDRTARSRADAAIVLPPCGMKNAMLNALNCCSTPLASGTSPKVLKKRVLMPPSPQRVISSNRWASRRLSAYGLDGSSIPALLAKLEEHGMTQLGENQDITLDVSRRIYEAAR
jgi:NADP-dependent alcohol dehydrogenase